MTEIPEKPDTPDAAAPMRSMHSTNFPDILERLGVSLIVSTYQAGRVILVRADSGTLNTHFRTFAQPMGLAAEGHRLAVGCKQGIWELRNMPDVARKVDPPGKHDAFFLPRNLHITGDIDVHEMAWDADGRLCFVNTRFSCLCTLDHDHSFVPVWRPHFVTAYSPEDRCHLNGLCMTDGKPEFVTALGETDGNETWRKDKVRGGHPHECRTEQGADERAVHAPLSPPVRGSLMDPGVRGGESLHSRH